MEGGKGQEGLGLLSDVLILKMYNEIKFVLLSMAINVKVKI